MDRMVPKQYTCKYKSVKTKWSRLTNLDNLGSMWTKQNKKKVRILNNLAFQSGAQISSGPRSETLLFEFGPSHCKLTTPDGLSHFVS
jgi:hypothetical protein